MALFISMNTFLFHGSNNGFNFTLVSTDNFGILDTIDEGQEGGHSGNAVLASQLLGFLNIDLDKNNVRVGYRQLFDQRSNHLAGTAPVSIKINENVLVTLQINFKGG